jgi:integrase
MIRSRDKPDGLPFRVYERHGVRVYSIGYKMKSGKWAFRYECPVADLREIAKLRKKAIEESVNVADGDVPIGGFKGLVESWFTWQEALPATDKRKRAASTIAENKREAENLIKAFGHLEPEEITRTMGYEYLEACLHATDEKGNPRPRPEKGNKEISLGGVILEYGIRKGKLAINPFRGISKNKTTRERRLITQPEMDLAVTVGRRCGGARLIVALALKTAWLCIRRSVEVRGIQANAITEQGIVWHDGKDKTKAKILIEWSDELRATIDEAKTIKRNHVAGSIYIFGNMRGQRYTKGGWKAMLDDLMRECDAQAKKDGVPFKRFNLQECRPMGVTSKLDRGDQDTKEATGHTSEKMIATVYDRRPVKRATPAGR